MTRLLERLTYAAERFVLRGAWYRLAAIAGAVVAVSVGGGLLLVLFGAPETLGEAVWWAFLRLTDPGYLGDDEGLARRALSTAVTVLGYVLFMGALIAILSQALAETIQRLQRGETPIAARGHVLVLGLSDQTHVLLDELLGSEERVRRFLTLRGTRRMTLVVLVEELDETVRAELASQLGEHWDDRDIVLRTGSPLVAEHLDRVAFTDAAVILVPGSTHDADDADALTVKTVLSIANHPAILGAARPPRLVAEVADDRLVELVSTAHGRPLELLPTDRWVAQVFAQGLRHPGLSTVLGELLAFSEGHELYYPPVSALAGARFGDAVLRIVGGVGLGIVRPVNGRLVAHLDPDPGLVLRAGDRWVVIAADLTSVRPGPPVAPVVPATPMPPAAVGFPRPRRVLVLGWNRRVTLLLRELSTYDDESFAVDVVSVRPEVDRLAALAEAGAARSERLTVTHHVGDYTHVGDLARFDLGQYDNLLVVSRGWTTDGTASDAHTILCATILQARLAGLAERPTLLVELMDPDNATLFDERPGEVVLTPMVTAHLLAHVAIRPELHPVAVDLLGEAGPEFTFRDVADYGVTPAGGPTLPFGEVQRLALARGDLAIGVREAAGALDVHGAVRLAPGRAHAVSVSGKIVVLTRGRRRSAARRG